MATCLPTTIDGTEDENGRIKLVETRVCQIVKETFLSMDPMLRWCLKSIENIRKCQTGVYYCKGIRPTVRSLSKDDIQTMEECFKLCMEYKKMDYENDSFFMYLCTGKVPDKPFSCKANKKKNKKERLKNRRQNKKGTQYEDDPTLAFHEWKIKTQKMLDFYVTISEKQQGILEIIKVIDPLQKTPLSTIFKPDESEEVLRDMKGLIKELRRQNFTVPCTCGCLQTIVAAKLADAEQNGTNGKDGKCRCVSCGLDIEQVEAAIIKAAEALKSGDEQPILEIMESHTNHRSPDEGFVECKFKVRLASDLDHGSIIALIRSKVEWDYLEQELDVDLDTMTVSLSGPSGRNADSFTVESLQALMASVQGTGITTVLNTSISSLLASKSGSGGAGKTPEENLLQANVTFTVHKKKLNKVKASKDLEVKDIPLPQQFAEDLDGTTPTGPAAPDSDEEDLDGLETVIVDDKGTQTDFDYSDSEIKHLDESIVPLCTRSSQVVVKNRKKSILLYG